jgi:hypothetical protein
LVGFIDQVEATRRQRRQAQQARVKELQRELAALNADTTVSPKAKLDDAIADLEARLEVEREREKARLAEAEKLREQLAGAELDGELRGVDVTALAPPMSVAELQKLLGFSDKALALNRKGEMTKKQIGEEVDSKAIGVVLLVPVGLTILYQAYRTIFHSTGWFYPAHFGVLENLLHLLAGFVLFFLCLLAFIVFIQEGPQLETHTGKWLIFKFDEETDDRVHSILVGGREFDLYELDRYPKVSKVPHKPVSGTYRVYHKDVGNSLLSIEPITDDGSD